jgi:thymidylate kinase
MKKKIYIIEGIDGCGKDFVRDSFKELFDGNVKCLREPDGYFRQILKDSGGNLDPMDEYMTMWIGRFDLWNREILHDIESENIIINRSFPSTYAYQIQGRGLDQYEKSFRFWKKNLLDLFDPKYFEFHHVYLRVDLEIALGRIGIRNNSDGLDFFEEETLLKRTRSGYNIFYGDLEKTNFASNEYVHVIDANKSKDGVLMQLKSMISS